MLKNLKERWADPNTMVSDLSTAVSLTALGVNGVYKAGNAIKNFMKNRNTLANVTGISRGRLPMNLQFFGGKSGTGTNELVLRGTDYSTEYAKKLKDAYKIFKSNGYEVSEHGLNRVLGRINQGKIGSIDEVIDAIRTGTKYIDIVNGGTVIFKNGISIHIAEDGFIKTVIGNAKVKSIWEAIK